MQSPISNPTIPSSPIHILPPLRTASSLLQSSMITLFHSDNIYSLRKYVAMLFLWQPSLLWYCCIPLTGTQILWQGCPSPTHLLPNPTKSFLCMQQIYYTRWFNVDTSYLKSPLPILLPLIQPALPDQILFTTTLCRLTTVMTLHYLEQRSSKYRRQSLS